MTTNHRPTLESKRGKQQPIQSTIQYGQSTNSSIKLRPDITHTAIDELKQELIANELPSIPSSGSLKHDFDEMRDADDDVDSDAGDFKRSRNSNIDLKLSSKLSISSATTTGTSTNGKRRKSVHKLNEANDDDYLIIKSNEISDEAELDEDSDDSEAISDEDETDAVSHSQTTSRSGSRKIGVKIQRIRSHQKHLLTDEALLDSKLDAIIKSDEDHHQESEDDDDDDDEDDDDDDDDEETQALLEELQQLRKLKAEQQAQTKLQQALEQTEKPRKKSWRGGAPFARRSSATSTTSSSATTNDTNSYTNDTLKSDLHQKFLSKYIR